jgi:lipopolysaccharide biosynthesis glycosyltransferase
MNIAICFDKNYQNWATVCLNSIWRHYNGNSRIRLVILSDIDFEQCIWQLKRVLKNYDFSFDNPGTDFDQMPTGFHFNVTTYWRLALPKVLVKHKIEKTIYLDVDTLIIDDLEELYNINLEGKACGGCLDISSRDHTERMELKQEFAINGGVLLMDVERMNEIDWVEESNRLNNEGRIQWVDQDVINILLDNEIQLIDLKWNVQSGNLQNSYDGPVSVVHFTESGNTKPWSIRIEHRFLAVYNIYMRKSGFYFDWLYYEGFRRFNKYFRKA